MNELSISKSVGRAFQILEYFKEAREPCTTRDLEKALKYPYSSVRAIVKSLSELGYMVYDRSNKTYFPTQKLLRLGDWVQGALVESSGLADLIEAVGLRTNESAALATRNFIFCNFLRVKNSGQPVSFQIPIGVGLTLTNSVIGRVILSQMPEKEADRLISYTRYWAEINKAQPVPDKGEILSAIESARANGYLTGYNIWLRGVGTIAYPIQNPLAKVPLTISVSGPAQRIKFNEKNIRAAIEKAIALHGT
jgi:IclR family KDG regulon transcriptional repressor